MNLRKRYKVLEMMSQQKQIHMNGVAKMAAKVQSFSKGTVHRAFEVERLGGQKRPAKPQICLSEGRVRENPPADF